MIDLLVYCEVKDKCCLGYFGDCDEYLYQLDYFRSNIEYQLPGLTVYIAARDASIHHLADCDSILSLSEFRGRRHEFGLVREILCDLQYHPIEKLLADSGIDFMGSNNEKPAPNNRCLIITQGSHPTRPLTDAQVQGLMDLAVSRGLSPEFGDDPTGVGHVWGIESWQLWRHAARVSQKGCLLVSTGLGTNFYRTAFPLLEVLK